MRKTELDIFMKDVKSVIGNFNVVAFFKKNKVHYDGFLKSKTFDLLGEVEKRILNRIKRRWKYEPKLTFWQKILAIIIGALGGIALVEYLKDKYGVD